MDKLIDFNTIISSIFMNAETELAGKAAIAKMQRNCRKLTTALKGELTRLARGCNELSLLCAEMLDREKLKKILPPTTFILADKALVDSMCENTQKCDCFGQIAEGRYALILPGFGLSQARLHGEYIQKIFGNKMRPQSKKWKITCALGIVCVGRDEVDSARDLLERGSRTLRKALAQSNVHIYQERIALSEHPTLVHSDEKRFLFFGEA